MLSELRVAELLAALGRRTPAPASGAAVALTGALGAALAELASRYAGDEDAAVRAHELALELVRLGDQDAAAYAAFMEQKTDETRAEIVRVPEAIANLADEVVAIALRAGDRLSSAVAGDAEAAAELARAAARVARGLARLNSASAP
jgi:formiminotetrahydrofolate cyclodeaminase